MKNASLLKVFSLGVAGLTLSACVHKQSLPVQNYAPHVFTMPLNNPQQVDVEGPFQVQVISGSKMSKLVMVNYEPLNTVRVMQSPNCVIVKPKSSAIDEKIRPVLLKFYLRNPGNLVMTDVDALSVTNQTRRSYNLYIKNVPTIQFTGNAIVPVLMLDHSGYFAPKGTIYLGTLTRLGPANATINQALGGALNITTIGTGNLFIKGQNLGLSTITHEGPGSLVIENTGRPRYLRTLTMTTEGSGPINIEGLYNTTVHMRLNSYEPITLSGYLYRLNAYMRGRTQLNGANLTVRDAYIRSYDHSLIVLRVSHQIFAHSQDQSKIEFYGYPKYKFMHARDASAILQLSPPIFKYTAKFN